MLSLGFLSFVFLASVASSQACSDYWSSTKCANVKQYMLCGIMTSYCRKTCGDCDGQSCGFSTVMSSRVIAGSKASVGAWPWQIRLLKNGYGGCGGSLITPKWVVTAAHCVDSDLRARSYDVVLGANDVRIREQSIQTIGVSRVIMHPKYDKRYIVNDIALLELEKPALLNNWVSTVCLPSSGEKVPVGTQCYLTGWGKTKHPGSGSPTLQQVALPVVSKETCTNLNTRNSNLKITDAMLCAGHGPGRRESGCHGDSGGPFVCRDANGRFTLQGAVSWGSPSCDTSDSYTVLARVSYFRKWINQYTGA